MMTVGKMGVAVAALLLAGFVQAGAQARSTLMSRLVVVGDSLSAGFQSYSLFDSESVPGTPPGGQRYGFAALIAKQARTPLTLPLISLPGIPPALSLSPTGQIVRGTSIGIRENPFKQPTNLSVPAFRVADAFGYPVD